MINLLLTKKIVFIKAILSFFKKPIYIKFGVLKSSILGYTAIVKEDVDYTFLFLFAIAETEKYRETLREFYDVNHCNRYDCFGLDGYPAGWKEYNRRYVWERGISILQKLMYVVELDIAIDDMIIAKYLYTKYDDFLIL